MVRRIEKESMLEIPMQRTGWIFMDVQGGKLGGSQREVFWKHGEEVDDPRRKEIAERRRMRWKGAHERLLLKTSRREKKMVMCRIA